MPTEEKIVIRTGRTREQFLRTEFDTIDCILNISDSIYRGNPITLLGFYTTLKRFINRKDYSRDNEVNFRQSSLKSKMKISNTLYYDLLKASFNTTLIDIEKYMQVTYFINLNLPDTPNLRFEEDILVLSSLSNTDIFIDEERLTGYIAKNKNVPGSSIKIVSVSNYTSYILNDFPLDAAIVNGSLVECRSWDDFMSRYNKPRPGSGSKKSNISITNDTEGENLSVGGVSSEQNEGLSFEQNKGVSSEKNTGISSEQKHNNIKELSNTLNEINNTLNKLYPNKRNDQSINQKLATSKRGKNNIHETTDGQKDGSLNSVFYNLDLSKYYGDLATLIRSSIEELYYNPYMSDNVLHIPHEVVMAKVIHIDNETITYAIDNYIKAVQNGSIIKSPNRYFAKCLWTAIIDSKLERASGLIEQQEVHEKTTQLKSEIISEMSNAICQPELIDPFIDLAYGLSEVSFNTWFKSITKVTYSGNQMDIVVPTEFHKEQIKKNYLHLILDKFANVGITKVSVLVE